MDQHLRRLEQGVMRAPGDPEARQRLRAELRRVANLEDHERWGEADVEAQDLVLDLVGRLLGPGYAFEGGASPAAGDRRHRVGRFRHRRAGIRLHLVPGGPFVMGSASGPDRERPLRRVDVPPFLVGAFPVLQREWDQVPAVPDERSWRGKDLPIEGVTWGAARAWLRAAGGGLRLPSEAEWEYACRAGSTTEFFWGDAMDGSYCWHGADSHEWRSHPPEVHGERANAFGLVDVSGNVGEWCEDDYVGGYGGAAPDARPRRRRWTLPFLDLRVVRGGDARRGASACRSAARDMSEPTAKGAGIGFRAARSLALFE